MIKLYTKTVCPKCMGVKYALNHSELEYEIINIDEDESAKELLVSKGFMSVPILEVDGELIGHLVDIASKIDEMK